MAIWGRPGFLKDFFSGRAFDNGISSKYPTGCAATGFCATFFGEGKEYDAYGLVDSTVDSKKSCFFKGGRML